MTAEMVELVAESREASSSGAARRLRAAGMVPAVVYGGEGEPVAVQLNAHDFWLTLKNHGEHQVLDLKIDGAAPRKVLIQDVQHDVYDGTIQHADFIEVRMDEKISLNLPLELVGDAKGVKSGGILELLVSEVEIECLPGNVVEQVELDVSDLDIGDSLTVADLKMPAGIEALGDPELMLVTVAMPKAEKTEDEAGDDEAEAGAVAESKAGEEE